MKDLIAHMNYGYIGNQVLNEDTFAVGRQLRPGNQILWLWDDPVF